LNVPATGNLAARFHREHERRYGYHHPGREIELVTLRLRAGLRAPQERIKAEVTTARKSTRPATHAERAPVFFGSRAVATAVYERADLVPGRSLKGPAVITEYSATTVIPPGKKFWVDRAENLLIAIK
jgi:N-methylhydantoinase A